MSIREKIGGGGSRSHVDDGGRPLHAPNSISKMWAQQIALKVRISWPRCWPWSRCSKSRHDPKDPIGTANIGFETKVGAKKTVRRPTPSLERLLSGPNFRLIDFGPAVDDPQTQKSCGDSTTRNEPPTLCVWPGGRNWRGPKWLTLGADSLTSTSGAFVPSVWRMCLSVSSVCVCASSAYTECARSVRMA